MEREIKFRGLVTDTKQWVFGYYFNHAGVDRIFVSDKGSYTVIPESVGQFTGLHDKNGVEIYEGDILNSNMYHKEWFVEFTKCDGLKLAIKYNKEFEFYGIPQTHEQWSYNKVSSSIVTGNIHES